MMGAPGWTEWARAHRRAARWRSARRCLLYVTAGGALTITGTTLAAGNELVPAHLFGCIVAGAVAALALLIGTGGRG